MLHEELEDFGIGVKMSEQKNFVVWIRLIKGDPRPSAVWASHAIYRRGQEIIPIEQLENTVLLKIDASTIPELFEKIVIKAWEEGLYDEGNRFAPWFPLVSEVIRQFMYVDDKGLHFIPGCEPREDWSDPELQYVSGLVKATTRNTALEMKEIKQLTQ